MAVNLLVLQRALRKERVFRDRSNPLDILSDDELFRNYRFSRSGIFHLIESFEHDIRRLTRRNKALSPTLQILITLRFYATGAAYHVFAEMYGIERTTVGTIITQVTEAIAKKAADYITFPTGVRLQRLKHRFFEISRFPGVIGAIDGTHVRLFKAPLKDSESAYVNRKGWHSINTQLICDADFTLLSVVARWPGSAHDNFIFTSSAVGRRLTNENGESHLLGDSGYYQRAWLMTPFSECREQYHFAYNR